MMAPQGTSEKTSDRNSEDQTRPPVLRLRGAGKPEHGESDYRSEGDLCDLDNEESYSSSDESSTCSEEEEKTDRFECVIQSATECIECSDQQPESLDSLIPVMRLRGGTPKKRIRRAYF